MFFLSIFLSGCTLNNFTKNEGSIDSPEYPLTDKNVNEVSKGYSMPDELKEDIIKSLHGYYTKKINSKTIWAFIERYGDDSLKQELYTAGIDSPSQFDKYFNHSTINQLSLKQAVYKVTSISFTEDNRNGVFCRLTVFKDRSSLAFKTTIKNINGEWLWSNEDAISLEEFDHFLNENPQPEELPILDFNSSNKSNTL